MIEQRQLVKLCLVERINKGERLVRVPDPPGRLARTPLYSDRKQVGATYLVALNGNGVPAAGRLRRKFNPHLRGFPMMMGNRVQAARARANFIAIASVP